MKELLARNKTIVLLISLLMIGACRDGLYTGTAVVGDDEVSELTFTLDSESGLKSAGAPVSTVVDEWTLLLVNSQGEIEESAHIDGCGKAILKARAGEYSVNAWANTGKALSFWTPSNAFGNFRVKLEDEKEGRWKMGVTQQIIVDKGCSDMSLCLRRMVARVTLKKVSVDFPFPVNRFVLKRIYLTNVAGDCLLSGARAEPTIWHNRQGSLDSEADALICDTVNTVISKASSLMEEHSFYCYANPMADDTDGGEFARNHTRLVLECALDELTYYYALDLPDIKANHSYIVDEALICNRGSLDVDDPLHIDSMVSVVGDWSGTRTLEDEKGRRIQP